MKKFANLAVLALFLGGLMSLWLFVETRAQIDFFTFFIPYRADDLDDIFDASTAFPLLNDPISTTISISIYNDDTIIYYDHWEDGLEPNLTTPAQTTTRVWGDHNPDNGFPAGNIADTLQASDVIVLGNEIPLPRDPANYFFDGGDKLTAVGGPLAVTLTTWPVNEPSPPQTEIGILYAGAWELYPTNKWGTEYYLPIGEDLGPLRPGFQTIAVNVQAVQDDTTIQVFDLDADGANDPGAPTTPLQQGQQVVALPGDTVNVGAHIKADKPVQVHIFATDPNSTYEARAYSMIPFDQWTNQSLAPRSSDGDFWLHNPDNTLTLTIRVQSFTMTTFIDIPPGSTGRYPPNPGQLSGATGLHFSSVDGRKFYGVAALDPAAAQDWGYALLPFDALTTQTFVGWGVGNNNDPPGPNPIGTGYESPIYVTALTDTTIFADFDNNGVPDASFNVAALQEVPITKTVDIPPGKQYDLTGAFLYTQDGTQFLAVWGQDELADTALPSIDVGTSVIPFPSLLVQKTVNTYSKELACSETTINGDTIQYRLEYFNNSANPVHDVIIQDNLPPEVTYIPNSTAVNGVPIADDSSGTPFPLDNGGFNLGTVAARDSGFVTLDAKINNPNTLIINRVELNSKDISIGTDFALIFTSVVTETEPIYEINTTLVDPSAGLATSGEVITFSLALTNTGSLTITNLPLNYIFDDAYLNFQAAQPNVDAVNPGLISWNDLTNGFGDLPPNQTISAVISFVVDTISSTITTTNKVIVGGGKLDNNKSLPTCSDEAPVILQPIVIPPTDTPTPGPTDTPTNTPTSTPGPTDTPTNTPPPEANTPTPTPDEGEDDDSTPVIKTPPPPGILPTPTETPGPQADFVPLPVAILPETGFKPSPLSSLWPLALLSVLGALIVWAAHHRRR